MNKLTVPLLVDPLALMLSTEIYLIFQEILHPHVPVIDALAKSMEVATSEQREFVVKRAQMINEISTAVLKAAKAKQHQ